MIATSPSIVLTWPFLCTRSEMDVLGHRFFYQLRFGDLQKPNDPWNWEQIEKAPTAPEIDRDMRKFLRQCETTIEEYGEENPVEIWAWCYYWGQVPLIYVGENVPIYHGSICWADPPPWALHFGCWCELRAEPLLYRPKGAPADADTYRDQRKRFFDVLCRRVNA
jgi:hypothetical protein